MVAIFDDQITLLINISDNDEIQTIVDYIVKANLGGSIISNENYKKSINQHQDESYRILIEEEIIKFGNKSILNLYNRGTSDYFSIVCDIADRFGAKYSKQDRISDVELSIILAILANAWQKMSKENRKYFIDVLEISSKLSKKIPSSLPFSAVQSAVETSGAAAFNVIFIVANAVSKTLLGRDLPIHKGSKIAPVRSSFVVPIGEVINDIWESLNLAGPAYRLTIPCAIHIALLRQQNLIDRCVICGTPVTRSNKYCPNCGTDLNEDILNPGAEFVE